MCKLWTSKNYIALEGEIMMRDVPAAEFKQVQGSIPACVLMIVLFPVFLILALLSIQMHPNRAGANPQEHPAGELLLTN